MKMLDCGIESCFRSGMPFIDHTGKKYNEWTVLRFSRADKRGQGRWWAKCSCGTEKEVNGAKMASGQSRSCGCKKGMHTHGAAHRGKLETEYKVLSWILNRCNNPMNKDYKHYGAKGVRVAKVWDSLAKYPQFLKDMGRRPSRKHTIDRWPNCAGNYEPGNCRWATRKEQSDNRRVTVWLDFEGVRLPQTDMARRHGLRASILSYRLREGWDLKRALTTPAGPSPKRRRK